MKKILAVAATLSLTATATLANQNYPIEVIKDGTIYNCGAVLTVTDGVKTRNCIEVGGVNEAGGGLFATGLGGIGLVGGIAALMLVGIVATNDDNDTTISTD
ncbi:hypothetical protein Z946_4005 [Sulfitobacter noctilucicola]|uniref:Uncharacterized protein n=1 Tax=Sulfitobacter noctilucicola TaxID=1342301 RepID=A0A7W6M7W8_9RHOB|nr:hypothetical protein [Sulfitobacter noctilucicola]KIN65105.1 hypothetical protein Z946_4005 [Sulfitobacter noctilucicola]MBB4173757.1 hypothetical protein [Sulfitobacter noctilucicola]